MKKLFKAIFSTWRSHYGRNWWTYLSMIVESVILGDLVGSLRSAGHVNGELIRIDRHWSRPRSWFGSRTSQQHAHNQQRHPKDHVVDGEWRRRVLRLSRDISGTEKRAISRSTRFGYDDTYVAHDEFSRCFTIEWDRERLFANRSQCSTELASLTSVSRRSGATGVTDTSLTDGVVPQWKRDGTTPLSFARRRRRRDVGVRVGWWSYPATQKTRKTAGYSVQCAFVSRARSRKDAVGILAGASVVILIVTEGGVRFSCFLTCATRICITMFRHGRARVRANVCKLPSSFCSSRTRPSSLPLYFSFLGWGK